MTFKSLPITVREVKATEAVLERLYASAKLGQKGGTKGDAASASGASASHSSTRDLMPAKAEITATVAFCG